jgi:hypothetical protein
MVSFEPILSNPDSHLESQTFVVMQAMTVSRYDRIINELCHFYKASLIKTGLMFHKYHLLNQLQVFMIQKITKMSFNIPLSW